MNNTNTLNNTQEIELESSTTIYEGHSHSFDVGIAKSLGMNAAVVFNHIVYWLKINASKGHNIHEGKVWMYESRQEISDFLEYISPDSVERAINKLIDSGLLIKGNFSPDPMKRTRWFTVENQKILEIKKSITKVRQRTMDCAPAHNASGIGAQCIYKEQEEHLQEEQQQQEPVAVVVSSEKKKMKKEELPKVYTCLNQISIDPHVKVRLTKKYTKEEVSYAVACLKVELAKGTVDSMAAWLTWACENPPEVTVPKEERLAATVSENKSYAKRYDGEQYKDYTITALNEHVEIGAPAYSKGLRVIEYSDPKFMQKFHDLLERYEFRRLK